MRSSPAETTLVVGGGLAGAAAACRLAQMGLPVELIERSAGPHDKVCGEFISIEAQQDLAGLGVALPALGAVRIERLLLAAGRRSVTRALPFTGFSLSRRVLDEALLQRASALGAVVRRGDVVRGLSMSDGWAHRQEAPEERRPVVLATGKHGLRGAARRVDASALIGFKMYFATPPGGMAGEVQIHLFENGYAGLEPVEGGRCNLSLLVSRDFFSACGGTWPALLATLCETNPALASGLAGTTPLLDRPMTIAGVPYGFVHRVVSDDAENLFRVGDQLAVIPSFSGDGMAIALRSGIAAAVAIALGTSAHDYHRASAQYLRPQIRLAGMVTKVAAYATGRRLLVEAARLFPTLVDRTVRATRLRMPG